jgi:hypothetical protein
VVTTQQAILAPGKGCQLELGRPDSRAEEHHAACIAGAVQETQKTTVTSPSSHGDSGTDSPPWPPLALRARPSPGAVTRVMADQVRQAMEVVAVCVQLASE